MNKMLVRSAAGGGVWFLSFSLSLVSNKRLKTARCKENGQFQMFFFPLRCINFSLLNSVMWNSSVFCYRRGPRACQSSNAFSVFFFSAWLSVWRPLDQLLSRYDPLALFLSWLRSAAKKNTLRDHLVNSCITHNHKQSISIISLFFFGGMVDMTVECSIIMRIRKLSQRLKELSIYEVTWLSSTQRYFFSENKFSKRQICVLYFSTWTGFINLSYGLVTNK